jgi:N-acetylmuramic acid 6-phosphate etherase
MSPQSDDELPPTEQQHPDSGALGAMSVAEVIALMASAESLVLTAVAAAGPDLAIVAEQVAPVFDETASSRLVLLGAGTGGRIAIQEVSELPPTFGVTAERARAIVASSAPVGPSAVTADEDDTSSAADALDRMGIGSGDVVVGLAASGRTPFVVAGLRAALAAGAWCCGIANNPNTPLLTAGHHSVLLDTGPEILTGSTRLKAGTAQKIALNRVTTAAAVAAGKVTGSFMTELRGKNDKLRARAVRIVAELAGVGSGEAEGALRSNEWQVRRALRSLDVDPDRR